MVDVRTDHLGGLGAWAALRAAALAGVLATLWFVPLYVVYKGWVSIKS